jgi:hypothetical protein
MPSTLPASLRALLLVSLAPIAPGCVVDLGVDELDAVAVADDGDDALDTAGVVAVATTRRVVQVLGDGRPVAGARIASRSARGQPVDVGFTGSDGRAHVRVADGGFVVAAAPGFGPAARTGGGELRLAPLSSPERAVVRLQQDRPVLEVVFAGANDDVAVPRTAGLARAPAGTAAPASRFVDVAGHAAALHIDALASRGVVAGDPDGRFRPDDTLTRAELVTLVLRATGIALDQTAATGFVDVDAGAWFAPAVGTARALEIVRGDPDGRFRPRDTVTRAELAAVLVCTGALPARADAGNLADVDARHWARAPLLSATGFCRLLDVDAAGAVRPDARATRAEAAVALSRLLSCGADRTLGPGSLIGRRAADGARATFARHHQLLGTTGLGTHYGDESSFHRLSLADKRAFVAARARPGTTPLDPTQMTRSSCIEYAMELAGIGYRDTGAAAAWAAIDRTARDEGLFGTKLAADLVDAGWRAIYVNADTAWSGRTSPDNEHSFSLAVARDAQTYYDVPLAGAFLDWKNDETKQAAMGALPFGVLVLRGGTHVVAVADGAVHELARSEGPDGHVLYDDAWSAIIDTYANEVYGGGDEGAHKAHAMWNSGVLVVPPGVELAGVTGL